MRTMTTATTLGQCFVNRVHGRGGIVNGIGVVGIECSLVTVRDRAEARRSGRPPPPMEWTYCHPRHQG